MVLAIFDLSLLILINLYQYMSVFINYHDSLGNVLSGERTSLLLPIFIIQMKMEVLRLL